MYGGLAAWEHLKTLALYPTRADARSQAGAGAPHNGWTYVPGTGWVHSGGAVNSGGPMDPHGGWSWVGAPLEYTTYAASPMVDTIDGSKPAAPESPGVARAAMPWPALVAAVVVAMMLRKARG